MNFTILTPGDSPLSGNKSDATDGRFGGHREHSKTSKTQDYTGRTGSAVNKKENPTDKAVKDVDDLSNLEERKREFSYQADKEDVQKNNETDFITASDSDRRPRMDEGSDAVQTPESSDLKQGQRENRWHFDSSNKYEGEIS